MSFSSTEMQSVLIVCTIKKMSLDESLTQFRLYHIICLYTTCVDIRQKPIRPANYK